LACDGKLVALEPASEGGLVGEPVLFSLFKKW
jgi:hypothetical protein